MAGITSLGITTPTFANPVDGSPLMQPFQTADIGSHFNYLSPKYEPNFTIRTIDDHLSEILTALLIAEIDFDSENYFDSDLFTLYYEPYAGEMERLLQMPYHFIHNISPLNKPIELCKSIEIQEFYEMFYDRFSIFAATNYNMPPEMLRKLEAADKSIRDLKTMNDDRLLNPLENDELECGTVLIGSVEPQTNGFTPI